MRSRLSKRQQIALALLGSVVINVALACAVAFAALLWPTPPPAASAAPAPIRLEVTREPDAPAPEPRLVPAEKPTPPPVVNTLDRQRSDHPPEDAVAQSDKDTQAASELPPKNDDLSKPTQDGRESPVFAFDTQEYVAGEKANDNAGQGATAAGAPPPPPPPPTPQVAQPPTDPPRPQPNRAAAAKPQPTPVATAARPAATPLPARPEPQEFAMLAPTPRPPPEPSPEETVDPRQTDPPRPKPSAPLELARSRPQPPQPIVKLPDTPGYRPQTQKARLEGGLRSDGRQSSIAAKDTPLGRYHKALSDAIGSRWYYGAKQHEGLIPIGLVRIHFTVDTSGKVRIVKVVEGDASGSLATMSIEALLEANVPPIPPEVAATLEANRMDIIFTFAEL